MSVDPAAGDSARAIYEAAAEARRRRDAERWGRRLGALKYRLGRETSRETRYRKGAEGEEFTGRRLEKHLRGTGVVVLHDLRVPDSRANIDHVCIGPGGVTIVDAKNYKGKVDVRRGELRINGRRQGKLVAGMHRQLELVRTALEQDGVHGVDIRAALSMANVDGLPLLRRLQVEGVLIDGPRRVAKLARRSPSGEQLNVALAEAVIRSRLGR